MIISLNQHSIFTNTFPSTSRLYSEKAYVLSRGFVRRALEIPLGGLEAEITRLYHRNGRLQKVIDDSQRLIEKSRNSEEVSEEDRLDLAVPRLTAGGIIALERTLVKLRGLLRSSPATESTQYTPHKLDVSNDA